MTADNLHHLPEPDAEAVGRVLAKTTEITGIRLDLLLGSGRPARIARARQLAMTAIWRRSVLTLMDIAAVFARDHTTVIAARQRITRRIRTDPDLHQALRTIEAAWSEDLADLPPMPIAEGSRGESAEAPASYEAILDGRACLGCGVDHRSMRPIPNVETPQSSHVFSCDRCRITPESARIRVDELLRSIGPRKTPSPSLR